MLRLARPLALAALFATVAFTGLPLGSAGPEFGDPLPGLSRAEQERFRDGREAFAEEEDVADGLGPVFNETSCGACHSAPALGGGSDRLVTRFGTTSNGRFDPLAQFGGSLVQDHAIGPQGSCNYTPEQVPAVATIVAHRRSTPLFGLGLVDAVPDAAFREIAATQAAHSPATAGRVHVVDNLVTGRPSVGRFGWKAQVPSLLQFAGDAYLNEMGITNPLFKEESCPNGDCNLLACNPRPDPNDDGTDTRKFADYMTFLGAPPRGREGRETRQGEIVFANLGCGSCHLPTLVTAPNRVRALDRVVFRPYSDFLLHDMGALGDGIAQGDAKGNEIRTAPLWGLRAVTTFLHDGRATTVRDAILLHDGQGKAARDRFASLPRPERDALLAFLASL